MRGNKDRKREEILEAAAKILARLGYNKTSLADIAGEMGLTGPALLYYFKGKKHLFEEVVRREGQKVMARVRERLKNYDNPGDAIMAYPVICLEEVERYFQEREIDPRALNASRGFFKEVLEVLEEEEKSMVKKILDEGARRGIFDIEDSDVLAIAIVTVVQELVLRGLMEGKVDRARQDIKVLSKYLTKGIFRS